MPRPQPHSLALFSLVLIGDGPQERARAVLEHTDNSHLVSTIPDYGDQLGLDIGFHIGSASRYTLATLGRSGADITIEGSSISRIHCSFEIHQDSGAVMLYDRSNSQSTQVCGKNATPFELGRIRRVVVGEQLNTEIGIGGVGCDLVRFKLVWHQRSLDMEEQVRNRIDNPRLTRTVDEVPTVVPSQRLTRIHTPGERVPILRYAKVVELGRGEFGEVCKAVDVDTGRYLAAKIIKKPALGFSANQWRFLKREIETLAQSHHPYIVEYVAAQWKDDQVEIFTSLKEGSLEVLMSQNHFTKNQPAADLLLNQMLQALDYLAYHGIIHRDVKPANILYTKLQTAGLIYQLTDFGLCNLVKDARTYAGTPIYMAPEVLRDQQDLQTSKVDVWSLFVTLACALNVGGFQKKPLHTVQQRLTALAEAAQISPLDSIKEMAVVEPEHRFSAAQMLVKLYNGKGLTTPRSRVTQLATAVKINKAEPVPASRRRLVYNQISKRPARTAISRHVAKALVQPHALATRLPNNVLLDQIERQTRTKWPEVAEGQRKPNPQLHLPILPGHQLIAGDIKDAQMPGAFPN